MIRQLIYVSNSLHFEEETDLETLLNVSRKNNTKAGISGMLLFHDGLFLQVLEGDHDAVQKTYERIEKDERHRSCRIMADLIVEQREFPDWSMGYEKTTGDLSKNCFADLIKQFLTICMIKFVAFIAQIAVQLTTK